jgi:hypothetical protein
MKSEPRSAGVMTVPAPVGVNLRTFIDPSLRSQDVWEASVRVRAGVGAVLRRMALNSVPFDADGNLEITATDRQGLISSVLFAGDGVIDVAPVELRDEVVAALTSIRDSHAAARP